MKTLLTTLTFLFVVGYKSVDKISHQKEQRFQGHITLVAAGGDFIVTAPAYHRFQAPKQSFPQKVWDYVHTQPTHKDGSSLNGQGSTAWVDVSGHIENGHSNNQVFVATQVHHMTPAHPRYLTWRRLFGTERYIANYTE